MSKETFKVYQVWRDWRQDDRLVVAEADCAATPRQWRLTYDCNAAGAFRYRSVFELDYFARSREEAIQKFIVERAKQLESMKAQLANAEADIADAEAL